MDGDNLQNEECTENGLDIPDMAENCKLLFILYSEAHYLIHLKIYRNVSKFINILRNKFQSSNKMQANSIIYQINYSKNY